MKTIEETLNFCYEFTCYDQYKFDRVIELHRLLEVIFNVLSESNFKHEDNRI